MMKGQRFQLHKSTTDFKNATVQRDQATTSSNRVVPGLDIHDLITPVGPPESPGRVLSSMRLLKKQMFGRHDSALTPKSTEQIPSVGKPEPVVSSGGELEAEQALALPSPTQAQQDPDIRQIYSKQLAPGLSKSNALLKPVADALLPHGHPHQSNKSSSRIFSHKVDPRRFNFFQASHKIHGSTQLMPSSKSRSHLPQVFLSEMESQKKSQLQSEATNELNCLIGFSYLGKPNDFAQSKGSSFGWQQEQSRPGGDLV